MKVDAKKLASGFAWTYAERITAQLISFLVSIILARLLTPNHYGIISIVMIFITLCNAFVSGGFGNALVQKKDADRMDFNTMLICSIVLSCILYVILFVCAPMIATFYDIPLLKNVIRVLGVRIPLSGINSIQQAKIQKELKFKKFFWATFIGTIISAIVGITMAYWGFGVWALVSQYLTNTSIDTLVLFLIDRWDIRFEFSFARARKLLKYGWKVLVTTVVFTVEGDIRSLIIGKVFGSEDLAYYDQGNKFPNLIVTNVNSSIGKVLFPTMSIYQDDLKRLKDISRRAISVSACIIMPLLVGLISVADNFVVVLLTEKWLPCVPYLRLLCIVFMFRPLTTTCQQAIMAIGRSDVTLKIEIIINVVAITLLCIAVLVFQSVMMIALGYVVAEIIAVFLFLEYTKKLIGYTHLEQFNDILPTVISNLFMAGIVLLTGLIPINPILLLVIQIIIGLLSYIIFSYILKNAGFLYLIRVISSKTKSKNVD